MLTTGFLNTLRCVHTLSRLRLADAAICDQINQAIERRSVFDPLGRCLTRRLDGMLVNESFSFGYPIYDQVPYLLRDDAILLDGLIGKDCRSDHA